MNVNTFLEALRPRQWAKNALVAVPLFTAHLFDDPAAVGRTLVAVADFSLLASSIYLFNDLVDMDADRLDPIKRFRPFASGRLSPRTGRIAWPILAVLAFAIGFAFLPPAFVVVLAGYAGVALAYTLWAKQRVVLDVVTLGVLYTLRIGAGAAALDVALSMWLLSFSMLLFFSLALVKRVSELTRMERNGSTGRGRGYRLEDVELLSSFGVASSMGAVLIFALFVNDPDTAAMYRTPELLWGAVPVLLAWLMHVWLRAHRGEILEDVVLVALKDPHSLMAGALVVVAFVSADVLRF